MRPPRRRHRSFDRRNTRPSRTHAAPAAAIRRAALTVVSVLVTVFQFASGDDNGAGMVMLLICALLSAVAAVIRVLIEAGHLKESGATVPVRPEVSAHGH